MLLKKTTFLLRHLPATFVQLKKIKTWDDFKKGLRWLFRPPSASLVADANHAIRLERCVKFQKYLRIQGCLTTLSSAGLPKRLKSVRIEQADLVHQSVQMNIPSPDTGDVKTPYFQIDCLMPTETFPEKARLEITTTDGQVVQENLKDLSERHAFSSAGDTHNQFLTLIDQAKENLKKKPKLLDIGGRDRSKGGRTAENQRTTDKTIIDVVPGEGVDVVGDAHELSKHFKPDTFDFLISQYVFEHLIMPWKVAIEMNKVLKTGGYALIQTHQTIGLHDLPWDFWRFSDESWKALFNANTGFRIITPFMGVPSHIVPFFWRSDKRDSEKSAGFECSDVLVQKMGPCKETWLSSVSEITETHYPEHVDGFDADTMKRLG